jgi:anti-repressor protein
MGELVVKIENVNGENVVSSRVIAEQLGKEHKRVLQDITEKSLHDFVQWIKPSKYKANNGQEYSEYLFTKDGFILLMMNYTGYNDFKVKYIKAFNEMEKALQNPLSMLLSLSKEQLAMNNLQLAQMIQEKDEVIEKQEVKLVEQKPLVEFAEQVSNSCDSIEIGLFSKIIQDENIDIGRNKLFQWLKDNGYLMKDNQPYQKYKTEGYFKVVEVPFKTPYGIRIGSKTLITGIGQIKILNKLKSSFGTSK